MKFLTSNFKELDNKRLISVNGGASICTGNVMDIPGYIPKYHEMPAGYTAPFSNNIFSAVATVRSCSMGNGIAYVINSPNTNVVYASGLKK